MTDRKSNTDLVALVRKDRELRDRLTRLDTDLLENLRSGLFGSDAEPDGYGEIVAEWEAIDDAIEAELERAD